MARATAWATVADTMAWTMAVILPAMADMEDLIMADITIRNIWRFVGIGLSDSYNKNVEP
jgi:RES domain-containing protein